MPPLAIALWIANIILETAGHLSFKSVASAHQAWRRMLRMPLLWIGICCFAMEFVVWFGLLSLIPLSQAMLINSIQIVAVILAGRLIFGERLDALRVAGALFVSVGVALAGASA